MGQIREGRSMVMAARSDSRGKAGRVQDRAGLGDLDAIYLGPAFEVIPGECLGILGGELITQRQRVVVVEQNEVAPGGEFMPDAEDQAVLDGTRDGAHIEGLFVAQLGQDHGCIDIHSQFRPGEPVARAGGPHMFCPGRNKG